MVTVQAAATPRCQQASRITITVSCARACDGVNAALRIRTGNKKLKDRNTPIAPIFLPSNVPARRRHRHRLPSLATAPSFDLNQDERMPRMLVWGAFGKAQMRTQTILSFFSADNRRLDDLFHRSDMTQDPKTLHAAAGRAGVRSVANW